MPRAKSTAHRECLARPTLLPPAPRTPGWGLDAPGSRAGALAASGSTSVPGAGLRTKADPGVGAELQRTSAKSRLAQHIKKPSPSERGGCGTPPTASNQQPAPPTVKQELAAKEDDGVWWRCPRGNCTFTIYTSMMPVKKRSALKYMHLRLKHRPTKIATGKEYRTRGQLYRAIWSGAKVKTSGGLVKGDLMQARSGRIVSKRKSAHSKILCAKNGWADHWRAWCASCSRARKELGLVGFVKVKRNGSPAEQSVHRKSVEYFAEKRATDMNKLLANAGSLFKVKFEPEQDGEVSTRATSSDLSSAA